MAVGAFVICARWPSLAEIDGSVIPLALSDLGDGDWIGARLITALYNIVIEPIQPACDAVLAERRRR
jgi:hypothetical protein